MVSARFALATGGLSLQAVVEAGREAEGLGYEAVLVGEARLEVDAFVTAAAVLQATTRVRCGPGIANVHDRSPAALARGAATLDRLAPARALLGVGRGDGAQVPHATLEDAVRTCRALLRGEPAGGIPAPPERAAAQNPVPLLLAAVGPRTLRLAGAAADGVLLNYGAPPEYVRWAVAQVREGAEQAGRDPDTVDVYAYLFAARSDTPSAPERLAGLSRELAELHAEPGQGRWLAAQTGAPSAWDEGALRRFAVVGSREECLARIEEYREAGARCPVLMPSAMRALHR
jgi:5,10-methylenetetrahydromethanopterin reductase